MDLNKMKLNAPADNNPAENATQADVPQENASQERPEVVEQDVQAEKPAEEPTCAADEEDDTPILIIPDDYDADEIDYSAGNTMSDVVAAKDNITEVPRYEHPKLKGKEAWDNFWYHHKTTVIVCVAAVVMFAIIIIQSIPTKYDYHFNIYADGNFGVYTIEDINTQLMEYAQDVDGTGEIMINTNRYNMLSVADPYEPIVAYVVIEAEFSGDYNAFLIVVDKYHYDFMVENVGEEAFEAYEGYPTLISLKDSEFITGTSESNNNDVELFLALIALPEKYRDDEEMVARHDAAKELLGRILADHPELKKAE